MNNTSDQAKCVPVLGMNAWNIGLVVITLERYFKVVHAVAHRKYYKKWMTKVGVAVPWITGFCTFAIPAYVWSTPVPGQCPRTMVITDKVGAMVSLLNVYLCTLHNGCTVQVCNVIVHSYCSGMSLSGCFLLLLLITDVKC